MNDPVIGYENAGDGSEPDGVAVHEIEQRFRGREDVPGCHAPGADDGADVLAAPDVDVFGAEGAEVGGYAD